MGPPTSILTYDSSDGCPPQKSQQLFWSCAHAWLFSRPPPLASFHIPDAGTCLDFSSGLERQSHRRGALWPMNSLSRVTVWKCLVHTFSVLTSLRGCLVWDPRTKWRSTILHWQRNLFLWARYLTVWFWSAPIWFRLLSFWHLCKEHSSISFWPGQAPSNCHSILLM